MYYDTVFYLNFINLGVCLQTSLLVFFRKNTPFYVKLFPFFIVITIVAEIIGHKFAIQEGSNHIVYNFFSILAIVFYFIVLREMLEKKQNRRLVLYSCFCYPIIALLNIFLFQGPYMFHTYTYYLGAALIIAFTLLRFNELFFVETPIPYMTWRPDFWICCGLLSFFFTSFAAFGATHIVKDYPFSFLRLMSIILTILEISLYMFFTIAFICQYLKPIENLKYENEEVFQDSSKYI